MKKLDPAKTIIEKLGGPAFVGRSIGVPISTVCAWENESQGRGRVPIRHWGSLKALAKSLGRALEDKHLQGLEEF